MGFRGPNFNKEWWDTWDTPTLLECARECTTITEFGIFKGCGLATFSSLPNKKVIGYDITLDLVSPIIDDIRRLIPKSTELIIRKGNTLDIDIEQTDMLFVDTVHRYDHVKKELIRHSERVNKYIVIHDVNYPKVGNPKVRQACYEFADTQGWNVTRDITEYTGLIRLERM